MAPSFFRKKFNNHTDSNNKLPKPHPLFLECNEHLSRLEDSITPSTSSLSISHKLDCLQDLHDCVDKLFQLPLAQKAIAQESKEKWVNDLLDGSLRLLDACTATKDAIVHTKECARELQSTMRRRSSGSREVETEVRKYIASRKVVRKAIYKALKKLNVQGNKCITISAIEDHETVILIGAAREMEAVTLSVLESILCYVSGPTQSQCSSWSIISKLIDTKKVACTQEADRNVFLKIDAALDCFLLEMKSKSESTMELLCQFEELEPCTQDLEEGLERMFKKLIKIRVSLLNIINH